MWRLALLALVAAPLTVGLVACTGTSSGDDKSVSELRSKYPTPLDLANARAKCLNARGWGVEVTEEGQIRATYPSNRQSEYEQDNHDCLVELGADPDAPTPEKLVEAAYPQYKRGAECLRAAGWPISAAPSLQSFKESYETQPWFPWAEIPAEDVSKAIELCPAPEPTY